MTGRRTRLSLLGCLLFVTLVMGLTAVPLHEFLYFRILLGLIVLAALWAWAKEVRQAPLLRLVAHGGFVCFVAASLASLPTKRQVTVVAYPDIPVNFGMTGHSQQLLPFALTLRTFSDEGGYASALSLGGHDDTVRVNHPVSHDGWKIYQMGGDATTGQSTLLCVHDAWERVRAISLWLILVAGALAALARPLKRGMWQAAVVVLIFGVYAYVVILRPRLFHTTVPVLQSAWFVPHVTVYILAYAVMTVATLRSLFGATPPRGLVRMGWGLLTMGMVMGALWAKESWGDFWGWDPKETWALATWLAYLIYLHGGAEAKRWQERLLLVFAFLLLQMCWWGVNYLPAASHSVHVY